MGERVVFAVARCGWQGSTLGHRIFVVNDTHEHMLRCSCIIIIIIITHCFEQYHSDGFVRLVLIITDQSYLNYIKILEKERNASCVQFFPRETY